MPHSRVRRGRPTGRAVQRRPAVGSTGYSAGETTTLTGLRRRESTGGMPNEIFAASWPKSTDPADEIATALNTRPKFVASRTLDKVTWNNSHLLKGDVAEEVAKLKVQEGGEIQVHGSSDLLQTLLKHNLIDTLSIWQFPVVVGTGKRLFGEGTIPGSFRLVDIQ